VGWPGSLPPVPLHGRLPEPRACPQFHKVVVGAPAVTTSVGAEDTGDSSRMPRW